MDQVALLPKWHLQHYFPAPPFGDLEVFPDWMGHIIPSSELRGLLPVGRTQKTSKWSRPNQCPSHHNNLRESRLYSELPPDVNTQKHSTQKIVSAARLCRRTRPFSYSMLLPVCDQKSQKSAKSRGKKCGCLCQHVQTLRKFLAPLKALTSFQGNTSEILVRISRSDN